MKNNILLQFLCSIPIILISLYIIPFLGICLIIMRYLVYSKKNRLPFWLIAIGIFILIPKGLDIILNAIKFNTINIPYFDSIINSELYIDFIQYSKLLLIVGIIFLIVSLLFQRLLERFGNFVSSYIRSEEQKDAEIRQKNDLIMQEKRYKLENTQVVYCPYCGADNILTSKTGTCKYCRRKIQVKEKSS